MYPKFTQLGFGNYTKDIGVIDASDLNLLSKMIEFEDVYHACYSVEIFRNAYSEIVHPLLETDLCNSSPQLEKVCW
jgi:hypothetical protein